MQDNYLGMLIKMKRLSNNWSQEDLCNGICAVSYLSKIEQCKVAASPEILDLLIKKLNIEVIDDPEVVEPGKQLVNRLYDAIFLCNFKERDSLYNELTESYAELINTPLMIDIMVIRSCKLKTVDPVLTEFQELFNDRQLKLYLVASEQCSELIRRFPSAFASISCAQIQYRVGDYTKAIDTATAGYDMAARNGEAYLLLFAQSIIGTSYCCVSDYKSMLEHYAIAERIAKQLGAESAMSHVQYNIAASALASGDYEIAYDFFSKVSPSVMAYHKYAIACEKLGKIDEAKRLVDLAFEMPCKGEDEKLSHEMLEIVKYRLHNPEYLKHDQYGDMLLTTFERITEELPRGFALFHVPWVIEWYKAQRQYKQAFELMVEFTNIL